MKKNMEYKEPEFKVVITNAQDVLTASNGLATIGNAWDTSASGDGSGGLEIHL